MNKVIDRKTLQSIKKNVAIVSLFLLAMNTASAQSGKGDALLEKLRPAQPALYSVLKNCRKKYPSPELDTVIRLVARLAADCGGNADSAISVEEFCHKTDISIFTRFKSFSPAQVPDSLMAQYQTIEKLHRLEELSREENPATIVHSMKEITHLYEYINSGPGLAIRRKMSPSQRDYIRPFMKLIAISYDRYYDAANQYNPSINSIEQKRARLQELKKTYTHPIQQAFIRQQSELLDRQKEDEDAVRETAPELR